VIQETSNSINTEQRAKTSNSINNKQRAETSNSINAKQRAEIIQNKAVIYMNPLLAANINE
ncbi:41078_t:CDS:1, partial [Gigaspora margarita]